MSSLYRRGSLVGLGLAFSACSSGSSGSQAKGPKLEPWPSTGDYSACPDTSVKSGSSTPYDTSNTCLNLLSSAEASGTKPCGLGVAARLEGFEPGIVYIVVTSNGPEIAGSYTLSLSSETSRC